ncbi:MAG: CHAT domain-containing protein [Planctomycetes bacterium]|nr:CHAT domain-containing protein [Planctomycetota bacterium]
MNQKASVVAQRVFEGAHPEVARLTHQLGLIYSGQGKHEEALSLYLKSHSILQEKFGEDHSNTMTLINNIGLEYSMLGKVEQAENWYRKSLALREKNYGKGHLETAISLINLGQLLKDVGKLNEAKHYFEEALEIRLRELGKDHLGITSPLMKLGLTYELLGDFGQALHYQQEGFSTKMRYLDRELPSLSEAERFKLLHDTQGLAHIMGLIVDHPPKDFSGFYEIFCNWKGKGTRLQIAGLQISRSQQDPEFQKRKGEIRQLDRELSSLVLLPLAEQQPSHSQVVKETRTKRVYLEQQLNASLGIPEIVKTPGLFEIQQALPAQSMLVDFFVSNQVFAWVVSNTGPPKLFNLGDTSKLLDLQRSYLQHSTSRGGRSLGVAQKPGAELYQALWRPIVQELARAKSVLICPDGFLCELPFGILPTEDGLFLIEKYPFVYLTDASQLTSISPVAQNIVGSIAAVGGVNYFRRGELKNGETAVTTLRSRVGSNWNRLPATTLEIQALKDLHQYVLEWESELTTLEGEAATEEAVRAALPGKRYLHIATHGYFEPESLPSLLLDAQLKRSTIDLGEQVKAVGLLPGLLSGLVFAGVNSDADISRDDGYLSAEEIQHMDLSASDLVVLSACETALGSPRAGEGLMSLRRAFSVAGADTVISSLWKVDDTATAELMKDFYTNLWQKKMPRGEAMHQAKLSLLRKNRLLKGGDTSPGSWGAFVVSGSWQ